MNDTVDVKPGLNVNIVLTMDIQKEATDVRGAIVYDIRGADVILSQTNPPFTGGRHIGKAVSVTYLIREKNDVARYGFEGKVVDVIKEYNLSSSNRVPAILLRRHPGFNPYDLRMQYRLKPKLNDVSMALYLENEKVNLLDISIGGARFCHKSDRLIEPGKIRKMILSIDEQRFRIDAGNRASWFPFDAGRQSDLQYARVQFLNMDKACTHLLNVKLFAIQREILSENSDISGGIRWLS
jgi:hypothetical protein